MYASSPYPGQNYILVILIGIYKYLIVILNYIFLITNDSKIPFML